MQIARNIIKTTQLNGPSAARAMDLYALIENKPCDLLAILHAIICICMPFILERPREWERERETREVYRSSHWSQSDPLARGLHKNKTTSHLT